jgi:hypothetical protein
MAFSSSIVGWNFPTRNQVQYYIAATQHNPILQLYNGTYTYIQVPASPDVFQLQRQPSSFLVFGKLKIEESKSEFHLKATKSHLP